MIETDSLGAPVQVEDLDAEWLLALAEDTETQARLVERRKLRLAARWCVLHPATERDGVATWSEAGEAEVLDRDEAIGGDGTPAIAAFAAEPLAAALQLSTHAALRLIADALNLQHRLPRIWARVESLEVAPWRARRVAQNTAALSRQAAAYVDAALAGRVGSCGMVTIDRLVAEAAALFDPEHQRDTEDAARASWGVRISHGQGVGGYAGTSWLDATGDTLDLTRFHDLLCATAAELAAAGDDDPLEIRKAKAIAVITDRAQGLTAPGATAGAARTHLYLHATLAPLCRRRTAPRPPGAGDTPATPTTPTPGAPHKPAPTWSPRPAPTPSAERAPGAELSPGSP